MKGGYLTSLARSERCKNRKEGDLLGRGCSKDQRGEQGDDKPREPEAGQHSIRRSKRTDHGGSFSGD